jgi:hypothetical protein
MGNEQTDNTSYAPIAMFVYNRLENVKKTIASLLNNVLAPETSLYVFSDGGRDEKSWKEVEVERNVIDGISQVFKMYDRVVVIEDDVLLAPHFLEYMNDALSYYLDNERVMHVCGFTPLDIPQKGDVYFTTHMACAGGWGTWRDGWNKHFRHFSSREEALQGTTPELLNRIEYGGKFHCLQSLDRNPIPWDICWELAIYKNNGLCISPTHTLFRNIGLRSGTHFNALQCLFGHFEFDRAYTVKKLNVVKTPVDVDEEIETVLNPAALTDHGFRYNLFGKVVRYFYLKYFKNK